MMCYIYSKINMATCRRIYQSCTATINNFNFLFNRFPVSKCHQSQVTFSTTLKTNIEGIPPKPKRPLNPYFRFALIERKKLQSEYPNQSHQEILKMISQKWVECDPEMKEELNKCYKNEMASYVKELIEYENEITDEQKQMIQDARNARILAKQNRLMKSKQKELGRPKKPPSLFIEYLISKKQTRPDNVPYNEWVRTVSAEWAALPPEIKDKQCKKYQKLLYQYHSDLIEWEKNMVKLGHPEVVRKGNLLDLKVKETEK